MKLDISKFKKMRTEKDHTVLKHPDGHEIRVLHKPLSSDVKKQLDELPHFHGGGNPKLEQAYKGGIEENKALASKNRTEQYTQAANRGEEIVGKQIHKYSDGGEAEAREGYRQLMGNKTEEERKKPRTQPGDPKPEPIQVPYIGTGYADGGDVSGVQSAQDSMRKAFGYPHADGGPVKPPPSGSSSAQESMRQAFHFYANGAEVMKNYVDTMNQQPMQMSTPQADSTQSIGNTQAPPVDTTTPTPMGGAASPEAPIPPPDQTLPEQAQSNVAQANQAETSSAKNIAQVQGTESNIHGEQAKQFQDLRHKYETIGNDLHQKFEQTADQVMQGKIDPHHWWNEKSTGSKILTAIGMLFAGAGGGVSGHPEMIGNVINQTIDRDIDAQKANLNNKHTLLSKYMEMYNSLPQAEAAARLTLSAGVEGLINQQAAKLGSMNAMNAAQIANSNRRQALLPQMEGLAKGQVMMDYMKGANGTKTNANPQSPGSQGPSSAEQNYQQEMDKTRQMAMVNPSFAERAKDMEARYLPGVGASRIPVPDKLREEISTRKDLSDKLAQLELFSKEHQGTVLDRSIVNQGKAMAAQVQDAYRTAHQQGVFKESEKNFVGSILNADPTAFLANVRTLPGYRQARKFNDETVKQYYKSYGIKPFSGHSEGNTIRVKLNSTGQTGTIPANEYDPKKYTKEE